MVHACLRSASGTLLFRAHDEARALWDRITARVRCLGLVLMPDHIHAVLVNAGERAALLAAVRSYALWRNRHRGESGRVWNVLTVTEIRGPDQLRRTLRYLYLNPCRKGLVNDPAAWPWSTHRDAVGLSLLGPTRAAPDPEGFHRFVSADASVRAEGTTLPPPRPDLLPDDVSLAGLLAAVSALTRTTASGLRRRGIARDLFIRSARALTTATSAEIAAVANVHPSTVRHTDRRPDPRFAVILRVYGDPRFALLDDGDLRDEPSFRPYRHLR